MKWFISRINKIDYFEKKQLLLISLLLIFISSLPAFLGSFFSPQGFQYNGLRSLAAGDLFVYFSYINQIKEGEWLIYDLFTSEHQLIGMFNIWWLSLGLLAKFFNLSANVTLVISRIILIPVTVFSFYIFCSYFLKNQWQRVFAVWLGFFSGGLGFFVILLTSPASNLGGIGGQYNWPIDLWITEATLFNAAFFSSLVLSSVIFTLMILLLMFVFFDSKKMYLALLAGLLALVYLNFHPYYWPVIIAVPALFVFLESLIARRIEWRMFFGVIILFLVSLPSVVYHFWLIKNEEIIAFRALQNVTPMVEPINLLLGYGFLWIGLFVGIYFLAKKKLVDKNIRYLLIWLTVLLVLSYSPFPFQSRYTQGMQLPLVIITTLGLWYFWQWLKGKINKNYYNFFVGNKIFLIIFFILIFSFSVWFNFIRDIYYLVKPTSSQIVLDNYYFDQDFLEIVKFLNNLPVSSTVVLSDIDQAKVISAFALQKSFISHTHETIFFKSKLLALSWFYNSEASYEARKNFLIKNKIDYIIKDARQSVDLTQLDFLQPVVTTNSLVLYQVIR